MLGNLGPGATPCCIRNTANKPSMCQSYWATEVKIVLQFTKETGPTSARFNQIEVLHISLHLAFYFEIRSARNSMAKQKASVYFSRRFCKGNAPFHHQLDPDVKKKYQEIYQRLWLRRRLFSWTLTGIHKLKQRITSSSEACQYFLHPL